MTVTEIKQALGQWSIRLRADTPREILDNLPYFSLVALTPGRLNPVQVGDNLLGAARYVGVLRGRADSSDSATEIFGPGMAFWLGDEDDKGDVFVNPVTVASASFADSIRAVLPPSGSILEGTLYGIPGSGTFSSTFQYQTSRKALTYITDTYSTDTYPVSWRVNGDGTLDAGRDVDMFVTDPTTILVRKEGGRDMFTRGFQGNLGLGLDVEDYTTEVVLLAEGEGASTVTASASQATPYLDRYGNMLVLTRLISESETSAGNAQARATLQLNRFRNARPEVELSTAEYDVSGTLSVGDVVAVFDPAAGFSDPDREMWWNGQPINPVALKVTELTWPLPAGWTVALRSSLDSSWLDLSDWYIPEGGSTTIKVGDLSRALAGIGGEPVGTRPIADTSTPAAPAFTSVESAAYQSQQSNDTRAAVNLVWDEPLNQDGSTVLDGDHYEIRLRATETFNYPVTWARAGQEQWNELGTWGRALSDPEADTGGWKTYFVGWDTTVLVVTELMVAAEYEIQIRAVDAASPPNKSPWSASTFHVTRTDTIAPNQPAPPVVAASRIAIQVIHELGAATGGTFNLAQDLHHLDVHVGGPAFYPDESNRVGSVTANSGHMAARTPIVATFQVENTEALWVRVVAVDRFGNRSIGSEAVESQVDLIDSAHISDLTASKITAGTISADLLISGAIKTAESGQRAELNQLGLQLYDADGELTVNLTADDDTPNFISITDGYQNTLASIDQEGNVQGQTGTFTEVVVDGQGLLSTRLPRFEKGTVAYGVVSAPTPPNPASLPYGLMQLAFQAEEGRSYQLNVRSNMAVIGGVNGQESPGIRVWDCGDVDTGSETGTLIMFANHAVNNTGQGETVMDSAFILEPTVGRHQLYAQMYRNSGSGTIYVGDTEMWIKDMGPTIVNTGQANYGTSGSTSTPSVQTYTKTYLATGYQTYNGNNTQKSDTTANQGFYSSNQKSLIFFDFASIWSDLSGASDISMAFTAYAEHWYYNAGGTAVIGTHLHGSAPGTYVASSVNADRVRSAGWPKPGWRSVDITSFAADFKAQAAAGIALGPGPDSSFTYYGKFTGSGANRPYLTVIYTK